MEPGVCERCAWMRRNGSSNMCTGCIIHGGGAAGGGWWAGHVRSNARSNVRSNFQCLPSGSAAVPANARAVPANARAPHCDCSKAGARCFGGAHAAARGRMSVGLGCRKQAASERATHLGVSCSVMMSCGASSVVLCPASLKKVWRMAGCSLVLRSKVHWYSILSFNIAQSMSPCLRVCLLMRRERQRSHLPRNGTPASHRSSIERGGSSTRRIASLCEAELPP